MQSEKVWPDDGDRGTDKIILAEGTLGVIAGQEIDQMKKEKGLK